MKTVQKLQRANRARRRAIRAGHQAATTAAALRRLVTNRERRCYFEGR